MAYVYITIIITMIIRLREAVGSEKVCAHV